MISTPEEDRRFRRDMTLFVTPFIISVLVLAFFWNSLIARLNPARFAAATPDEAFTVASGTWDWSGADGFCVKDPHTISFSADRSAMFIAHREPWTDSAGRSHRVSEYELQYHDASTIRGAIVGESRRTDEGVPVIWDLVLTSSASYAWHRTDWLAGATTKEVVRCPAGTDSLVAPP